MNKESKEETLNKISLLHCFIASLVSPGGDERHPRQLNSINILFIIYYL
jgi:hypothetical protein